MSFLINIPRSVFSQSGFCWFRRLVACWTFDMQVSILSEQWVEVQNWFGLLITSLPSLSIPRHFKLIYFGIKITSTQDGEVIGKNGPAISDHKKRLMKNLLNQNDSHLINFDIRDQPTSCSSLWIFFVPRPRSFQRFHAVIMKLYKPHHH